MFYELIRWNEDVNGDTETLKLRENIDFHVFNHTAVFSLHINPSSAKKKNINIETHFKQRPMSNAYAHILTKHIWTVCDLDVCTDKYYHLWYFLRLTFTLICQCVNVWKEKQ